MFDITSSKLLILAIVALIVVGPKDLPILLRTVGKYLGIVRRHAAEFRSQFDEAMREAELDQLKKEFEAAAREVHATVDAGARSIEAQVEAAGVKEEALKPTVPAPPVSQPGAAAANPADAALKAEEPVVAEQRDPESGRGAA